jgi:AraC-like DNA-binding protein
VATSDLRRLASAVERHTAVDGTYDGAVPGLTLFRSSAPSDHDAVVYVPCLCVVVQGAKELVVGDEAYCYDPARSLLVSVDQPASVRVVKASAECPCLGIGISLDLAVVGELLADGTAAPPPGPPGRGLALTRVEPALLDAVGRLVALLDTPGDVAALAPLVHREIIYRVLTGPRGARLRQIAAAGAPAHRIARAVGWLKEHFAEPLGVESLARRVGLRPSAFYVHFKGVTGLSPLQYQKRLRLQEARRLMLGEGLDVAKAGYRVGYESPSQFSREYRRLFGAPPRQDLAALRVDAQRAT